MDVFTAVADPTRRRIVEMLGEGDLDAGTIAGSFRISQPAISRHLKVLREADLVEVRQMAQRRVYRLRPEGLERLERWAGRYRSFWADRLETLATKAEEEER
jgi:DNA-binding transcriptional ArsR family regulator